MKFTWKENHLPNKHAHLHKEMLLSNMTVANREYRKQFVIFKVHNNAKLKCEMVLHFQRILNA